MSETRFAILIPVYQPQEELRGVIRDILSSPVSKDAYRVFVVNDGSTKDVHIIHEEAKRDPRMVSIITHDANRGKGAALKSGISAIAEDGSFTHIVTVDADGQHRIDDIVRVMDAARSRREHLVLGARSFSGDVPARSKFGNTMTKAVFAFFTDHSISDTQTGLRAFDIAFAKQILDIKKDRYDFELGMLIRAVSERKPVSEVAISTVYIEENKSSHFRPIVDSFRIYQMFIKYALSSFVSIAFDYVLFLGFYHYLGGIFEPNIAARIISLPVNFYLNKELVFKYKGSRTVFVKYLALALANPIIVAGGITALKTFGVPVPYGKIVAESCMFLVNFQIQKRIFK